MKNLLKFKKTVVFQILAGAGLVAAIALFFDYPAVAKGFVLGSFFSLFNFFIMIRHTSARLNMGRNKATVQSGYSALLRLLVLAVPLFLSFQFPSINLIATIIGVLNLQISIIIYCFVIERFGLVEALSQGR
jgi:hypothetical protein